MIARHVTHELQPQVLGLATVAGVFAADHQLRAVSPRTVLQTEQSIVPLLGETLERLDAAGHDLLVEQSAICSALVLDWLHRMRRHA